MKTPQTQTAATGAAATAKTTATSSRRTAKPAARGKNGKAATAAPGAKTTKTTKTEKRGSARPASNGTARHSASRNSASRNSASGTGASRNGASRNGASRNGASSNGAQRANGAAGANGSASKALAVTGKSTRTANGNGHQPDPTYLKPATIERRKSKINGWGVFALQDIPKNKRIVYYSGERISAKESGPREERYLEKGHIWCFQLNRAWVIDAAVGGNIARFVNHACKPNCYTHIVDGVIWIRAGRSIRRGEELTYNYYTEGQAEIPCKCVPGCQGML